ncbi:MAG: PadR family transcriptional regulator [Oscillospiraceae bacterium]
MPKKSLENLTESMFYVLMAFCHGPMCGIGVADFIDMKTHGRILMGPATLYTILGKFEKEKYIRETAVSGRKRTYAITAEGKKAYQMEFIRLRHCVDDAESEKEIYGDTP